MGLLDDLNNSPNRQYGAFWDAASPTDTFELRRILALPRKPRGRVSEVVRNAVEKSPGSLRKHQLEALTESLAAGGLMGALPVGSGKTYLAAAIPTIFPAVEPPFLILMPAALIPQARAMLKDISKHLNIRDGIHFMSYEHISRPVQRAYLETLAPKIIIADEAHCLKNIKAVRTKRVLRYLDRHPDVIFIAMSGTLYSMNILQMGMLSRGALKNGSPLPRNYPELVEWSYVLDHPEFAPPPGALSAFTTPTHNVRAGVFKHISSTPGVVAVKTASCSSSIEVYPGGYKDDYTERLMNTLETKWELPRFDTYISDALSYHRALTQISLGFYTRVSWPEGYDPEPWYAARRAWVAELRTLLKLGRYGDSPALVEESLDSGRLVCSAWDAWKEIRDKAEPHSTVEWITDAPLKAYASLAYKRPALFWVSSTAFGEALAARLNVPFYHGAEQTKDLLKEKGDRPVVLSPHAYRAGVNLQAFNENFILQFSSNPLWWTQLMGRTHRAGQKADCVKYYVHCPFQGLKDSLTLAVFRSKKDKTETGEDHKLAVANVLSEQHAAWDTNLPKQEEG